MERKRPRNNPLLGRSIRDELLSQFYRFLRRYHPTHDVTAEDVEDDVEVEASPFSRALQLGNIPTPDLIGLRG